MEHKIKPMQFFKLYLRTSLWEILYKLPLFSVVVIISYFIFPKFIEHAEIPFFIKPTVIGIVFILSLTAATYIGRKAVIKACKKPFKLFSVEVNKEKLTLYRYFEFFSMFHVLGLLINKSESYLSSLLPIEYQYLDYIIGIISIFIYLLICIYIMYYFTNKRKLFTFHTNNENFIKNNLPI